MPITEPRTVSEPLSWPEICARFPDQWVALVAIDWVDDDDAPYRLAFVAGHGSKRDAQRQAQPLVEVFEPIGPLHTGQPSPGLPPIVYMQ